MRRPYGGARTEESTYGGPVRGERFVMALGGAVGCPVCGGSFRRFAPGPRDTPNRVCWRCHSLERHRALALALRERPGLLRAGMRVLHVAPEPSVTRLLPADAEVIRGDLNPGPGEQRLDITDLSGFSDERFDAVVCMHVLEHVLDDRRALAELRRVLAADGWAVLNAPITSDRTDEDPTVTDPDERRRRYGQADHVRRYGPDYLGRLREAGFDVDVVRLEEDLPADRIAFHRLRAPDGFEPTILARRA